MNIEKLHKDALDFLNKQTDESKHIDSIGFLNYIESFRTITIGLPRQSGKTEYLLKLKKDLSCLMLVPNRAIMDHIKRFAYEYSNTSSEIFTFDSITTLVDKNRYSYSYPPGLKYSAFLIDEYSYMTQTQKILFMEALELLHERRMLTKDFYVLRLGTPAI